MAKWKNLYCYFPAAFTDEFLRSGIKPRRYSNGDVVSVFPSRSQVEKAMKGMKRMALAIIDSKKIDSSRLVKVDYNNIFYRGLIPPDAFRLVTKGQIPGFNMNPTMSGKSELAMKNGLGGKSPLANIHKPNFDKIKGLNNGKPNFGLRQKRRRL